MRLFEAQNLPFLVVFVLFEILELFEYLLAKYSIFEIQLFLLELEALIATKSYNVSGSGKKFYFGFIYSTTKCIDFLFFSPLFLGPTAQPWCLSVTVAF